MKATKTTAKRKRGKKGLGRLYIRNKQGKEFKTGTPNVKDGCYWLEFQKPTGRLLENGKPEKKKTRVKLLDGEGNTITSPKDAERERRKIVNQYVSATKKDLLDKVKDELTLVKAELEETEEEHAQAVEEANPPLTIEGAWEAYQQSDDAPETGADTLKYYSGYWKKFSKWIEEKHPEAKYLRDITPQTAKAYASSLRRRKLTPNTFNKHIGFLRLFFDVLAEPARTPENPIGKIKKRELKTNVRRELTTAELKEILKNADGELKTLFMLGTFTGLRLGDCCTLKWSEVDMDRRRVKRIPNKLRHKDSAKPVIMGIHPALLHELASTPPNKRKGYVLRRFADLYTFRNVKGRPTKQPDISGEIQKHLKDVCGIQIHKEGTGFKKVPDPTGKHKYLWKHTGVRAVVEVGFHSLRHTFVSLQAEAGTPLAVVQAIIGHGSPAMTAHYTHIGEAATQQAALAMPSDITDAEYEVLPAPLPDWAKELAEKLTSKNWKTIKTKLLANA